MSWECKKNTQPCEGRLRGSRKRTKVHNLYIYIFSVFVLLSVLCLAPISHPQHFLSLCLSCVRNLISVSLKRNNKLNKNKFMANKNENLAFIYFCVVFVLVPLSRSGIFQTLARHIFHRKRVRKEHHEHPMFPFIRFDSSLFPRRKKKMSAPPNQYEECKKVCSFPIFPCSVQIFHSCLQRNSFRFVSSSQPIFVLHLVCM